MHRKYNILFLLIACIFTACTPRVVREAQSVVAQADSLRAAGGMYSDSLQMAQAYKTLGSLSLFNFHFSTSYAHACYHYGRILREKENPVEAMQCFINATHSRTRDYHILGRVYSNMGDIAHLAGDYMLSYEMYKRSGEMYLKNKDSLLYYYDLNNMAFELAELGKKEETLIQLAEIEQRCTNANVLVKIFETKAVLYRTLQQYDSALYCAQQSISLGNSDIACIMIKTQAFAKLERYDSALYYANIILEHPVVNYQNIFNALYVVSHFDSTICAEEIRTLTSQREDIRYYKHDPEHESLTQAIQLLQQDLERKPNLQWFYAILATLLLVGLISGVYVSGKRRKHQLLSQQIDDLEYKNKITLEQMKQQIVERCSMFANSPNLREDLCWSDYDKMCKIVNQHFGFLVRKLQQTSPLSEREIRLCVLSLFNISYDTMAEMLYYSPNGIGKFKLRVAQKLGTTAKKMQQFLIEKAIDS